jgi:hypothetical protein
LVRFGKTSFGNPIWIDRNLLADGSLVYEFPNFQHGLENLEALTVFQIIKLRDQRRGFVSHADIEEALLHFEIIVRSQSREIQFIRERLRILSAFDLAKHARGLLNLEFCD